MGQLSGKRLIHPARLLLGAMLALAFAAAFTSTAIAQGQVTPPAIGVETVALTPESGPLYFAEDLKGALVVGVVPGGPAAKAGLQLGDVVRRFAGAAIADPETFRRSVRAQVPGRTVKVLVRRGGKDKIFDITIGDSAAIDALQPPGTLETDFTRATEAFNRNDPDALKLNLDLARRGHAAAQNNVGIMKSVGIGIAADPAEATSWFRFSAQQSDPAGQNNLAWQYWHGIGTPIDKVRALYWIERAAEAGNPDTLQGREQIRAGLSPQESALAQSWLKGETIVAAPATAPKPAASPLIAEAQRQLARLGYEVGKADGIAGKRTIAAVKAFQQRAGVDVDGIVTPALVAALTRQPTPEPLSATMPAPSNQPLGDLGLPQGDMEIEE